MCINIYTLMNNMNISGVNTQSNKKTNLYIFFSGFPSAIGTSIIAMIMVNIQE